MYPNITLYLPFIYDKDKFYTNQKCFVITGNIKLRFLIGYLNLKVSHKWIRENCPELQCETRELSKIFFQNIPVPEISEQAQTPIIELVNQILEKKEKGVDTSALEAQIDQLVYELYDLTDEEIAIVEGSIS